MGKPADLKARIERNSTKAESGCWLWLGVVNRANYRSNGGYPRMTMRRAGYRYPVLVYAHRVSLEVKLGRPLREGMEADHICGNPCCGNPEHLQEVTPKTNCQLREQRARARRETEHDQA